MPARPGYPDQVSRAVVSPSRLTTPQWPTFAPPLTDSAADDRRVKRRIGPDLLEKSGAIESRVGKLRHQDLE
jgi:hypothetical protein